MEVSRAKPYAIVEQRLLETGIVAAAIFRFQVAIGEEIEGWKVPEQLAQRRRLESRAVACFQFRFRDGTMIAGATR